VQHSPLENHLHVFVVSLIHISSVPLRPLRPLRRKPLTGLSWTHQEAGTNDGGATWLFIKWLT
jgi:hypothetical protein